jgi:hypothetical protein
MSTELVRQNKITIEMIERWYEQAVVLTSAGEVVEISDADSGDLIAWSIAMRESYLSFRAMQDAVEAELGTRIRQTGGEIKSEFGTARETIGRGSVSGIAAARIRDELVMLAENGTIRPEAVDNVAPLVAHVTPAKLSQFVEDQREAVRLILEPLIPEKRRSIKIDYTK